jgi:hypothetical protein
MIGGGDHKDNSDDNSDDHGNDEGNNDRDASSSSSTNDDYSLELEEEVYSKEEMNISTSSEEKLLIRRGRSDDGDTSDNQEELHRYFSNNY